MPITAGILEIMAGFWMLASAFFILGLSLVEVPRPWDDPSLGLWLWWMIPFVVGILGIMALVGGVFALLRRRWGLAFAGAIATVPLFLVAQFGGRMLVENSGTGLTPLSFLLFYQALPLLLSISVIALIILSKKEFK